VFPVCSASNQEQKSRSKHPRFAASISRIAAGVKLAFAWRQKTASSLRAFGNVALSRTSKPFSAHESARVSDARPIRLPFWALVPHVSDSHAGASGLLPAFSIAPTLGDYLKANHGSDRHIRLITRDTLLLLIADMHQLGSRGIRLDPQSNGTGGTEVPISELMKLTA
jgi:hypothetical protein